LFLEGQPTFLAFVFLVDRRIQAIMRRAIMDKAAKNTNYFAPYFLAKTVAAIHASDICRSLSEAEAMTSTSLSQRFGFTKGSANSCV